MSKKINKSKLALMAASTLPVVGLVSATALAVTSCSCGNNTPTVTPEIKLSTTSQSLVVNEEFTLVAAVAGTVKLPSWKISSSTDSISGTKLSDNVYQIKAKKAGKAKVTVSINEATKIEAVCEITVTDEPTPEQFFELDQSKNIKLTSTGKSFTGNLIVPKEIDGTQVYGIAEEGFKGGQMSSISFEDPDGLIRIGKSAFAGCTNLTAFTIPSSVSSIGTNVFDSSIKSVSFTEKQNWMCNDVAINPTSLNNSTENAQSFVSGDFGTYGLENNFRKYKSYYKPKQDTDTGRYETSYAEPETVKANSGVKFMIDNSSEESNGDLPLSTFNFMDANVGYFSAQPAETMTITSALGNTCYWQLRNNGWGFSVDLFSDATYQTPYILKAGDSLSVLCQFSLQDQYSWGDPVWPSGKAELMIAIDSFKVLNYYVEIDSTGAKYMGGGSLYTGDVASLHLTNTTDNTFGISETHLMTDDGNYHRIDPFNNKIATISSSISGKTGYYSVVDDDNQSKIYLYSDAEKTTPYQLEAYEQLTIEFVGCYDNGGVKRAGSTLFEINVQ